MWTSHNSDIILSWHRFGFLAQVPLIRNVNFPQFHSFLIKSNVFKTKKVALKKKKKYTVSLLCSYLLTPAGQTYLNTFKVTWRVSVDSWSMLHPLLRLYRTDFQVWNPVFLLPAVDDGNSVSQTKTYASSWKHATSAVKTFEFWLRGYTNNTDQRRITLIAPEELDRLLCEFFTTIKKPNGLDYTPNSLLNVRFGLDFFLKHNGYPASIKLSPEFMNSRVAFQAKKHQLKRLQRPSHPPR